MLPSCRYTISSNLKWYHLNYFVLSNHFVKLHLQYHYFFHPFMVQTLPLCKDTVFFLLQCYFISHPFGILSQSSRCETVSIRQWWHNTNTPMRHYFNLLVSGMTLSLPHFLSTWYDAIWNYNVVRLSLPIDFDCISIIQQWRTLSLLSFLRSNALSTTMHWFRVTLYHPSFVSSKPVDIVYSGLIHFKHSLTSIFTSTYI